MFTVRDADTKQFLFWQPDTEEFFFSTARCVIKQDYPTILQYLQCATEGYPEAIQGRRLEVVTLAIVAEEILVDAPKENL